MESADLGNLESRAGEPLAGFEKSLFDLSKSNVANVACLFQNKIGKIKALWFDEIMARPNWTDLAHRKKEGRSLSHRIDALYVQGAEYFLIEFKCDSEIENFQDDLFLKLYESVFQLIRHAWLTYGEAVSRLTYIVVYKGMCRFSKKLLTESYKNNMSEADKLNLKLALSSPFSWDYVKSPWKYQGVVLPRCGLDLAELMCCKMALTLNPNQFETFARENGWK